MSLNPFVGSPTGGQGGIDLPKKGRSGTELFRRFLPAFEAADLVAQAAMPYELYLKTDYWHKIRLVVRAFSGNRCERCKRGGRLQVHHKTYAFRGREHLSIDTLEALCESCHRSEHGITEVARPVAIEPYVEEQIALIGSLHLLPTEELIRMLPTRPCRNMVVRKAMAEELEQRFTQLQSQTEPLRATG